MTNPEDAPMNRRQWAMMLGSVCSPSFPADAIAAIVDMLPMLAKWGPEFFTQRTVEDIATAERRQACPGLGDITAVFAQRRREALPVTLRMGASISPALPAPEAREATPEEIAHVTERVAQAKAILAEAGARRAAASGRGEAKINPRHLTGDHLAQARRAAGIPHLVPDPAQQPHDPANF
jgi:hypothetical protein